MNIANKLQELTQEIQSFGDVISYTENPDDSDFRNACDLFSQYLHYQLQCIHSNIRFKHLREDMQQTTEQLTVLSELITPDSTDKHVDNEQAENDESYQWSNKLLDFCNQLQTLKSKAA